MTTPQKPLVSGFDAHTKASEAIILTDLRGKAIFVTGGHSGIGLETTRVLAAAGATVFAGARTVESARAAVTNITGVTVLQLDLADPASIDACAKQLIAQCPQLHVLVNNAGIMATPLTRDARGYEMQFATNHLGHFQLTGRLWPALRAARGARVITLSSLGHRFGGILIDDAHFERTPYDKWKAYGQSKTANALFARTLDERDVNHNIRAFSVHPGRIVETNLVRHMTEDELKASGISRVDGVFKTDPTVSKSIEQGAATTVWAATSAMLDGCGGVYCEDCDIAPSVAGESTILRGVRPWACDDGVGHDLWALSERLVNRQIY